MFVLAALMGETPLASLVGRWPRYEGLAVLLLYAGAAWVGARVVPPGADGARRLHRTVGAVAVVLAGFSLLDLAGISPVGPGGLDRSGSVLGNATDQAAVALMAALLLVRRAVADRHPADLAALAAALATVAVSGSRTALALTVVGVVLTAGRRRWPGAAAALVVLTGVALAVPATRERLLGLGTGRGRVEQWRLTLDLVGDHVWLGLGSNRYLDAFPAYENASFVAFTGPYRLADSPHSLVLQVLVAGGVLLLAVSLVGVVLVARSVVDAVRRRPETAPAALAVTAYAVLLTVNVTSAGPMVLAALLLGSVVAVAPGRTAGPAVRVGLRATWGLAVVVLLAACIGDVRLQHGTDAADERRTDAARAALGDAEDWRPWDSDLSLLAAEALAPQATTGDAGAAALTGSWARDGLRRTPDSYPGLVALGISQLARGDLAPALSSLDRAVSLAPHRPDGHVQRAIARYGLGDRDGALADLRAAQAIVPGSSVVRRLLRRVAASSPDR